MCSYHLFYTVIACMISLNPHDCPFLSHVTYEEIGSRAHPRSQSWSREHRGGISGEAEYSPGYCVLCRVWEHCFFHVVAKVGWSLKFTGWQKLTLGFQSCHWLRSPLQKEMRFLILIPSCHYFFILCILLGGSCQIISFLNLQASGINVQSCNNRMISLSRRIFTLIEQNSFVWRENPTSGRRCFHITFSWTNSLGELITVWLTLIHEIAEKVPFRYIKLKGALVCYCCHTDCRVGNSDNRNFFPQSLGGWKSEVKMSVGLVSSGVSLLGLEMLSSLCVSQGLPSAWACVLVSSFKSSSLLD